MSVVAVVPVRAGSQGLPGKNFRALGGVPLWERAVAQGRAVADEVIVTTDAPEILSRAPEPGVRHVARPAELATNEAPMAPVLSHLLSEQVAAGATVMLLQPTSPLRSEADLQATLDLYRSGGFSMTMTVTEADRGVLKWGRVEDNLFRPLAEPGMSFANRQSLPRVLKPNGAVYVFGRDAFLEAGGFPHERIGVVEMPPERSHDIDTADDLARAEALLSR